MSFQYVVKKPPAEYSQGRLESIYKEISGEEQEKGINETENEDDEIFISITIQPVNLICIMNESLSDLRVAGDFSTNQNTSPYQQPDRKYYKGKSVHACIWLYDQQF